MEALPVAPVNFWITLIKEPWNPRCKYVHVFIIR